MDDKNRAYCNNCGQLVSAATVERDGAVYLRKLCPDCGPTETIASSDAGIYMRKRQLDRGHDYSGCGLDCIDCDHGKVPNIVFVDLTNRCNLNCLCCIANIPSMGFRFEPPKEYFQRVFEYLGTLEPRPSVQFFGGEPTVREDLFELIDMAQAQGLSVRIVTNGLKLADPDFCNRLVATRATILIAFDGLNPETYRVLRGQSDMLQKKLKALENLGKTRRPKVVIMSLVAKGLNDAYIAEMIQKCHDEWPFVRSIQFIPLTHTWDSGALDYEPERITPDDVEIIVDDAFADETVEFVPAGVLEFSTLQEVFDQPPIPFGGVHPNCESMSLLLSCQGRFVPLSHFLTTSLAEAVVALGDTDRMLRRRFARQEKGLSGRLLKATGLWKHYRRLVAVLTLTHRMSRHVDGPTLLGCVRSEIPGRLIKLLGTIILTGRSSKAMMKYTGFGRALQFIILPFEDKETLETNRLERCRAAFAFINPHTDRVTTVPVCAWTLFSSDMMRGIAEKYGTISLAKAEAKA
jgi:uncharacterized radical SAM superfamily Fe-S cluster-containing enzyme